MSNTIEDLIDQFKKDYIFILNSNINHGLINNKDKIIDMIQHLEELKTIKDTLNNKINSIAKDLNNEVRNTIETNNQSLLVDLNNKLSINDFDKFKNTVDTKVSINELNLLKNDINTKVSTTDFDLLKKNVDSKISTKEYVFLLNKFDNVRTDLDKKVPISDFNTIKDSVDKKVLINDFNDLKSNLLQSINTNTVILDDWKIEVDSNQRLCFRKKNIDKWDLKYCIQ